MVVKSAFQAPSVVIRIFFWIQYDDTDDTYKFKNENHRKMTVFTRNRYDEDQILKI